MHRFAGLNKLNRDALTFTPEIKMMTGEFGTIIYTQTERLTSPVYDLFQCPGTFEPKVVPKRQVIITEQLEGHVLSMYTKGMITSAISDFIREIYAMKISTSEISDITNNIILDKNYETIYH